VYGECLARLTATRGQIIFTATPILGVTPIRKRFKQRLPGTAEILMTIDDATHIPPEDRAMIVARYKESERATRAYGADAQGEGAVFEIAEDRIKHDRDPATFPSYWRWLWGLDFSHAGLSASAHPFAAVLGAHDIDNDIIYIVHALRMRQALPINHVAALKENPYFKAWYSWPHDGNLSGFESGETFASVYRRLGLRMRPTHATFKDGGFRFESGIAEMESRFATGRLLIASHLGEVFDEYRGYHRVNNLVHKVDDDLMSAIRVLVMDIRFAQTRERLQGFTSRRESAEPQFAEGAVPGAGSWDIFTGQ
jgi:Terminase RNaseH-like domain